MNSIAEQSKTTACGVIAGDYVRYGKNNGRAMVTQVVDLTHVRIKTRHGEVYCHTMFIH